MSELEKKERRRYKKETVETEAQVALKKNLSILLVEPQGAGNIGSVARAMGNTGLRDLSMTNPVEYHTNECYQRACNAQDIIQSARVFASLKEATAESGLIIGATRRRGKLRHPIITLDDVTSDILKFSASNKVSLVFGREDRGLENDEMAACDILYEIPTHDDYPSLNLSHAVFISCHAIYMAAISNEWERFREWDRRLEIAPRREIEMMYEKLEESLRRLDYGRKGGEHLLRSIMRTFKRLFGRTALTRKEVSMLRGICATIEELEERVIERERSR